MTININTKNIKVINKKKNRKTWSAAALPTPDP